MVKNRNFVKNRNIVKNRNFPKNRDCSLKLNFLVKKLNYSKKFEIYLFLEFVGGGGRYDEGKWLMVILCPTQIRKFDFKFCFWSCHFITFLVLILAFFENVFNAIFFFGNLIRLNTFLRDVSHLFICLFFS